MLNYETFNWLDLVGLYKKICPRDIISRLATEIGSVSTAELLKNFSGKLIYIPQRSAAFRMLLYLAGKEATRGLRAGSRKYKAALAEVADIYGVPRYRIIKILKKRV
jgi:hypothetical protein